MALEGTTRRGFLEMVAQAAASGAGLATGFSLANGLYVPEAEARGQTVSDILAGTPFIELARPSDLDHYVRKHDNVFLMAYAEYNPNVAKLSRNLAAAVRPLSEQFRNAVTFLRYQDDRNRNEFSNLAVKTIPAWLLFQNGQEQYKQEHGPKSEEVVDKYRAVMHKKFQQFLNV